MGRKGTALLPVALLWSALAGAGTGATNDFDGAILPAAFPGLAQADDDDAAAELRRRLPTGMPVTRHGNFLIAIRGPGAESIARDGASMARRIFPGAESPRRLVIVAESPLALRPLAQTLYPGVAAIPNPIDGFYQPQDRLIVATPVTIRRELMRALLRDANPTAPSWFEQAAVTLYETSSRRGERLVPLLDRRMALIPAEEDLSYDVFAGICDCSAVSDAQLALMRLLLVFLDRRDELPALFDAVGTQGQYTTLLQALEAMGFDGAAWKQFAEKAVREGYR